jgi:hypothetical protein
LRAKVWRAGKWRLISIVLVIRGEGEGVGKTSLNGVGGMGDE